MRTLHSVIDLVFALAISVGVTKKSVVASFIRIYGRFQIASYG